jgi:glycerate 2-kinase
MEARRVMQLDELRKAALRIFSAAVRAVDPGEAVRRHLTRDGLRLRIGQETVDLANVGEVVVVGCGKAAAPMAAAVDRLLGAGRASGLVVTTAPPRQPLPNFRYIVGGHPYPTAGTVQGGAAARELAVSAGEQTLLLFLISGGGSAIMEKPLFDDISVDDLAAFNRVLVTCGANIYEMNVVRKHFSAVKGGRLAVAGYPARQATIYISDVPADKPSTVASGPTMPDESTAAECLEIARRYRLAELLPESYSRRLCPGVLPETPKPGDPCFGNSRYYCVLSNEDAVEALRQQAETRGWKVEVDLRCDDWPLERAAAYLLDKLRGLRGSCDRPACLVTGGELSCPVTGAGSGGRNAAFALYCAMKIEGENIVVMSGGTDGIDGNSPAAGAVADGGTLGRARALGLDAAASFRQSDSYTCFAALGDEIVTGPTGNNVRDLRLLVAY